MCCPSTSPPFPKSSPNIIVGHTNWHQGPKNGRRGNNLWWAAIIKEMKNVWPAFQPWENCESDIPREFQKIKCHLIFNIKMGNNFQCKARFVARGHTTTMLTTMTYLSVVARDSVQIAFKLVVLNVLDILACDMQNAYLTADCQDKIYTIAGPEFGDEAGMIMIVWKALYGLKLSGAAFWAKLWLTHYGNYNLSQLAPTQTFG